MPSLSKSGSFGVGLPVEEDARAEEEAERGRADALVEPGAPAEREHEGRSGWEDPHRRVDLGGVAPARGGEVRAAEALGEHLHDGRDAEAGPGPEAELDPSVRVPSCAALLNAAPTFAAAKKRPRSRSTRARASTTGNPYPA